MNLFTKLSILVILTLTCLTIYLLKKNATLTQKNSDQAIVIKSIEHGLVEYKNKFNEVYTRSMNQVRTQAELAQSKDSTILSLMRQLNRAEIKLKNVVQIGSTLTQFVYDTAIVYVNVDTVYNLSKPPHIYQYATIKSGTLRVKTDIRDTVTSISHLKKEFIEPRKKFFLARWFQRRHEVIYTDKHHSNPYIKTKEQTDITVIDKNGNPISKR